MSIELLTEEELRDIRYWNESTAGCGAPDCPPETCSKARRGRAQAKLLRAYAALTAEEREWDALRQDRDQFQAKAERLAEENRQVEGYAGRMETALEHILTVCRTSRCIETPGEIALLDLFDVIGCLAKVQDLRGYRSAQALREQPAQDKLAAVLRELECFCEFGQKEYVARAMRLLRGTVEAASEPRHEELSCPGCGRPMARVGGPGAHRGWTCVNCNAAGDPEEDH